MKLLTKLQQSKEFWFLFVSSIFFFFLRLPSLFEPYWYGDEGIYEVIGFGLRHGRMLYTGIWDNKPPMLYLIYALFSGDQTAARILSLLAGLGATWSLFCLSKNLFGKFLPAAVATAVFAGLFGIPLIEGNIANAENFMLLPGILAGLLIWKTIEQKQKSHSLRPTVYALAAGLLLGLSFLIKVVAVFDLAAFTVFALILSFRSFRLKDIVGIMVSVLPLIVGFVVPIMLCTLYFVAHHSLKEFFHSTLSSNVGYVNYANQFIIPQGFLILKTLILAIIVIILFFLRKRITKEFLFITLWTAFSIYNSLFSGRPYTHYALVLLPSLALLVGLFIKGKKMQISTGVILVALLFFLSKSFGLYSHPFGYYINFLQYVAGQKSTPSYQAFFDKVVPRDYALAEFINIHKKPGNTLFVWGNSGQIYKLTNTLPPGRFIVAYWIQANLPETLAALQKNEPTYIVSLPGEPTIPYSLAHYQQVFTMDQATLYEHL